ncbi:unnamed protein product, partial [Medioppia subpectinata]
ADRFVDLSGDHPLVLSAEDFTCGICLHVFNNAVDTQCGHTFCYHCLHRWLSRADHKTPALKDCPECRQVLATRKRPLRESVTDATVMLISGLEIPYTPCRRLNSVIDKLRIKCQYEWNGCPEVCPLESLLAHQMSCEHRKCRECCLPAGVSAEDHNCVQLLTRDRNEWIRKYRALLREKQEMSEELTQLSAQMDSLAETHALPNRSTIDSVLFGKFMTTGQSIEFTEEAIRLTNIITENNSSTTFKHNVVIPYVDLQSVSICADPSLPLMAIKPNSECALKIVNWLSIAPFLLDVESKDKSRIVIVFKYIFTDLFAIQVINRCKLLNSECKCKTIGATEAQSLLDGRI